MTRLITFILVVFFCACAGTAQETNRRTIPVKVSTNDSTESVFQLVIRELPEHPVSDTIYGQYARSEDVPFGGQGNRLKKNIIQNNPQLKSLMDAGVLTLVRDNIKGIVFSIKKENAPDSLNINLQGATYINDRVGWCPDPNTIYQINWIIRKDDWKQIAEETGTIVTRETENYGGNEDWDNDEKKSKGKKWEFSYLDLILLIFLIGMLWYVSSLANKINRLEKREKDGKDRNRDKRLSELTEASKRHIDSVTILTRQYRALNEELKDQKSIVNRLINEMGKKQQSVDTNSKKDKSKTSAGEKTKSSIMDIGLAVPVTGQNSLELTTGEDAFFEIKKHPDGVLRFSLRLVPELLSFFESNASMLNIYKSSGIIDFTDIPANSHVKVKNPGVVSEEGNGKYVVKTPLLLVFEN